jgi:DNA-binding NtrC family response regulator
VCLVCSLLNRSAAFPARICSVLHSAADDSRGMIGAMPAMTLIDVSDAVRELREHLDLAARVDFNVLIAGAPAARNECVARLVHQKGRRSSAPFVAVGCAALTEAQLDCRLFRDSDDTEATPTLLEHANGGTLFLDSVGELTPHLQTSLMRVLDRVVVPAVARATPALDVRIICSSGVPLSNAVRAGTFREDLYYRLNVLSLEVPPLTEDAWRSVAQDYAHAYA